MTAEDVRTHLRYSRWASTKLLEAALALPADQLRRDVGSSHKSIYETLAHIHYGDRVWLYRVLGLEHAAATDPLEVDWPRIQQRWEEWANAVTDADVARVIEYLHPNGTRYRYSAAQIVLHVVNHASLHRGQVMAMIRQLGVAPPATDLIFYYRELQAASA